MTPNLKSKLIIKIMFASFMLMVAHQPMQAELGREWTKVFELDESTTRPLIHGSLATTMSDKVFITGPDLDDFQTWSSTDGVKWDFRGSGIIGGNRVPRQEARTAVSSGGLIYVSIRTNNSIYFSSAYHDVHASSDFVNWEDVGGGSAFFVPFPGIETIYYCIAPKLAELDGSVYSIISPAYIHPIEGSRFHIPLGQGLPNHDVVTMNGKFWTLYESKLVSFDTHGAIDFESEILPFPEPSGHRMVYCAGKFWVIIGQDSADVHIGEIWSTSNGNNWELVLEGADFLKRKDFQAVATEAGIFVLGGFSDNEGTTQIYDDVWFSAVENAATHWQLFK